MFTDYLDRGALTEPDRPCIIRPDGEGLTHRELFELSHRVAAALRADGIGPGSKVAVFSPNSPLALALVFGIMRSGAAWIALNPMSHVDESHDLLVLLECDLLLHSEAFAHRSPALTAVAPRARRFGSEALGQEFEDWLAPVGARVADPGFQPGAPAMYMGTGGTTGAPKGVAITHRQLMVMSLAFNAQLREPAPSIYLMATPMTHAAAAAAFPTIAEGGTIVVHAGVVAADIFDSIERFGVTRIFLPPTAIYALLAAADVRQRDFSSLRHFIYAAAPMATDRLVEALEVFGPVMTQTYGQSEAPMICTCFGPAEHAEALADPALRHRLASCGRQSLVARVEIMDEHGNLLSPGERGEIVVRGDLVMAGYHKDPGATAETRRPGGWHGTGDIGYRDAAGYLYIVDRKRDMIISGGFNVFPSEVEQVLYGHPAILECAVIGVPDPKWGEQVTAVVETKAGTSATEDELIALCKERLGSIKAPKAVLFEELPRSGAGKVLKRELRERFWTEHTRSV